MAKVVTKAKAYLKQRHKRIRDAFEPLNIDGLLLTHAPDVSYVSNFTGDDSVGLLTRKAVTLISDFRYEEQIQLEAQWVNMVIRDGPMSIAIAKQLLESGCKRVGFDANSTTFGQHAAVTKAMQMMIAEGKTPAKKPVELVPVEDIVVNVRKVKDDHEVALIRKSAAVAEEAFEAIRGEIKPGQTESFLAGLLIMEMRTRGAETVSFEPIVAAGPTSSLPHYRPQELAIKRDSLVLFDWGAKVEGYCSDITRTMAIGRVPAKLKKIYQVVLEAQLAVIEFLRPGVTTVQADAVARDIIKKAGFGKRFGHGLGHGIGRDIHELPRIHYATPEDELRPGMVVTVEPGIYLPGEGGVRIEDDVLITHSGREVITTLPKDFESCHIE